MKDTVQIKADLYEGQHGALLAFYNTYPRLFVNKLLLSLCEGCMPVYPPTLAHFTSNPISGAGAGKPRSVAIRLSKESHPVFYEFYKKLPYGSRRIVMVNLMNHYAQLAEADRSLLEQVCWSGGVKEVESNLKDSGGSPAVEGQGVMDDQVPARLPARTPQVAASTASPEPVVIEPAEADPLASLEVGL